MDLDLIERLMIMLEKSDLDTLDVTENGMRIRLSKAGDRVAAEKAMTDLRSALSTNEHIVLSGLMGTFYRAPSPGADPYVKEGDEVTEGQVIVLGPPQQKTAT